MAEEIIEKDLDKKEERQYSQGEEFANAFTHALGALFAIYAIVMLAVTSKTPTATATTAIYGATLFLLFQFSTCYHSMTNKIAKKVFQKIDHSAIYLLIAGTYTPILLLIVPHPTSIILLAMIWYLAITGVVFSCITLKYKYLSLGLYLLMGWVSLFLFYVIWTNSSHLAVYYLLGGGVLYSVGCIFYLLKKIPYMHAVWHLFVLGGAVCHYLSIMELLK